MRATKEGGKRQRERGKRSSWAMIAEKVRRMEHHWQAGHISYTAAAILSTGFRRNVLWLLSCLYPWHTITEFSLLFSTGQGKHGSKKSKSGKDANRNSQSELKSDWLPYCLDFRVAINALMQSRQVLSRLHRYQSSTRIKFSKGQNKKRLRDRLWEKNF